MNDKNSGVDRTPNLKAVEKLKLPTPRLQFRWERSPKPDEPCMQWLCHYELVMRLGKYDIRNPFEFKKDGELTLALGGTWRSGEREPLNHDGSVDTPFRDGSHAQWDAEHLHITHIYAIYGKRADKIERQIAEKARPK